jgi:antitoxin HicB
MRFIIGGQSHEITREAILEHSRGAAPKQFDGRSRYYVELYGQKYPIKQLIHLATGLKNISFHAQDAFRILKKLGFAVHQIQAVGEPETPYIAAPDAMITEGTRKFAVALEEPDENGFILVSCPCLPGCYSQGRTDEEAITNIREAIRGYIASMRRHGEPVPSVKEIREVEVSV